MSNQPRYRRAEWPVGRTPGSLRRNRRRRGTLAAALGYVAATVGFLVVRWLFAAVGGRSPHAWDYAVQPWRYWLAIGLPVYALAYLAASVVERRLGH